MVETRLEYLVGACTASRDGITQGGDAYLWLPEQRSLLVVDGVGTEDGNGEDVTRCFQDLFQELGNFRKAIFGLVDKGFHATLTAVQLSQSSQEQAIAYVVGDSPLQRYSDRKLELLAGNDNLWTYVLEMDEEINKDPESMSGYPLSLLDVDVAMGYVDEKQVVAFIEKLGRYAWSQGHNIKKDVMSKLNTDEQSALMGNPRRLLQLMVSRCRDVLTMDLASNPRAVKKKLGDGLNFSLKKGNILLVTTDGVDATSQRISTVLGDKKLSSQQKAEVLVAEREKADDATAVVVEVQEVAA